MANLSPPNREIWLWLLRDGGAWTLRDLAREFDREPNRLYVQLNDMVDRGSMTKLEPLRGSRKWRYAVTGTCIVPAGMFLAEVQADLADRETQANADTYPQAMHA